MGITQRLPLRRLPREHILLSVLIVPYRSIGANLRFIGVIGAIIGVRRFIIDYNTESIITFKRFLEILAQDISVSPDAQG